jgi:hypothetical protein
VAFDGGVDFGSLFVAKVQDVEHGALREELEAADELSFFRLEVELAKGLFGFEGQAATVEDGALMLEAKLFLLLEVFVDALDAADDLVVVGEEQLEIEVRGITQGVNRTGRVRRGGIFEDAEDMGERVHIAERSEDGGVAGRVLMKTADVHVLNRGVGDFFRVEERSELVKTRLRDFGDADASGGGGGLGVEMGLGEDAEEGGLADERVADDAGLHGGGIVTRPEARFLTRELRR